MFKTRRMRRRRVNWDDNDDDLFIPLAITSVFGLTMQPYREWHVLPRSTHWRKKYLNPKEPTKEEHSFLDKQFKTSFRMTRKSFFSLPSLLQPYIEKQTTHLRPTIESDSRLAIFLYHIAHGASYTVLMDKFGVGKSTVSGIIGDVSRAIVENLSTRYIRFPNIDEAMRTMEHWRERGHIPGVVACIDGTHIPIVQPRKSGTAYCNRKGFYSINVQGTTPFEW